ncbi:hypothetical protein BRC63_05770 [Halobacteriales archaeon QH_10_70_21]|nr:MAG: hypothetical protein BRC63_05770 [Halobacteriales archaeon QH_10_70_21]
MPRWVVVGVAAGAVVSAGVAATFVVAPRLLPDGSESSEERRSGRSTEAIRRSEIRDYLGRIDEQFAENAEVAGERVAFLLPERDVAVTFDARTFLALERTPTHVILAEHEMPGVALGNRLPFETPDLSLGSEDPADREAQLGTADAAYDVLGLPHGADEEAVRRAYRRRVKEVHPDQGGDEEEFQRVQEAYDAAKRYAS